MNILNSYVITSGKEKVWTMIGPEFDNDAEKTVIMMNVLHGQKILALDLGATFLHKHHVHQPCEVDPKKSKSEMVSGLGQ